jgi:hypothetical protein
MSGEIDLTDIEQSAFEMIKPVYRKPIWEYISGVPMGRGYANDGKPFNIETANYLRTPFEAIKSNEYPLIVILSAVQMLKTFTVESSAAYFMEHDPGDTNFYIGGDDTARDHARSRILPWWRSFPGIKSIFDQAEQVDRHDVSTQEINLPGMTMRILGLNESTTQRVTLRRVLISDAFLSKRTGMLEQAMARTTQHEKDRKIIVESQGGEVGDDMDSLWKTTSMSYLWVKCPLCEMGQEFVFHRERGEDFVATPPKSVPSLDWKAWIEHHTPLLKSDANKHAGFRRGDEATVKKDDGSYNESEVIRQTYYSCYHCGGAWQDNPKTRLALDKSTYYVPSNTGALPSNLGLSWPSWAGQRLKWGGKHVMLGYLRAKQRKERTGNAEDLKQWWQKRAAKAWDEKLEQQFRISRKDAYEIAAAKHDAWRIFMVVDNQQDLLTQWVVVWACKKDGSLRQLWRGHLNGLEQCRAKQLEYIDDKKNLILKDQWVFLDGNYLGERIARHIVEKGYGHWTTYNGERTWVGWNLLQGSIYEYFTHSQESDRTRKFVVGDPTWKNFQIGENNVEVLAFPFSATICGQRFEIDRDGLGIEMLFLDRQSGEPTDSDPLSHHSQIHSNKLVESKSPAPRAAKMRYVPVPASAPDHYFHLGRMAEAVKEIWGVDGVFSEAEPKV